MVGVRHACAASIVVGLALAGCDGNVIGPVGAAATSGTSGAGGGASACAPGASEPCYSGPAETQGVGPCAAGSRVCLPDGSGFGPCEGEVTPKQESCATPEDDNCDGIPPMVCPGPLECGNRFGGADLERADRVAVDATGGVVVAGKLTTTVDFGGAPIDVPREVGSSFVARFEASGAHVFSRALEEGVTGWGVQVAARPTGEVLVATTIGGSIDFGGGELSTCDRSSNEANVVAAELTPEGQHVWSRLVGWPVVCGTMGPMAAEVIALDEGALIAGETWGDAEFETTTVSPGDFSEGFVARLGVDGDTTDLLTLGGSIDSFIFDVAVDPSGNIVLAATAGPESLPLPEPSDCVAKLDPDGVPLWATAVDGAIYSVTADAAGDVLARTFCGGAPCNVNGTEIDGSHALLRFDAAGELQWVKDLGDGTAAQLDVDAAGNVLAAGWLYSVGVDWGGGPIQPSGDMPLGYVVIFDASGQYVWSHLLPETEPLAAAFDPAGDVIVAGALVGTIDFGCGPLTSAGETDVFVVKLDAP